MISSAIGPLMAITPASISSVTAQGRGPLGQSPLAAADRGMRGPREIGLSIRRAGVGGEIHACRYSPGCTSSVSVSDSAFISGISMVGHPSRSAVAEVYPA
jgi:hypothetical protein